MLLPAGAALEFCNVEIALKSTIDYFECRFFFDIDGAQPSMAQSADRSHVNFEDEYLEGWPRPLPKRSKTLGPNELLHFSRLA